jgi:hypothetical protein
MTAPVGHNGGPPIDTPARKRGRPSSYTPELADIICDRLMETESLKSICRDPGMPSESAVLAWVARRPEFRRQYDQARMLGQHLGAEDVLEIADGAIARGMPIPLARRLIDAKKWHLGRLV